MFNTNTLKKERTCKK